MWIQLNRINRNGVTYVVCIIAILALLFFSNRYHNAEKHNKLFIAAYYAGDDSAANFHINRAIAQSKRNVVFIANKGTQVTRHFNQSMDTFMRDSLKLSQKELNTLSIAQTIFKKANELNPDDGMFLHNISWAYFLKGKKDSAIYLINEAIHKDTFSALYYVSRGIFYEKQNNLQLAFTDFYWALRLSPEMMDSRFFSDLKKRHPEKTDRIVKDVIVFLEEKVKKTNSPIFKARLAKFYLNEQDLKKSKQLYQEVTKDLPNLNRPWYYLGLIQKIEKDTSSFKKSIQRALLLDNMDFLPNVEMGNYYYDIEPRNALAYYRNALQNCARQYSDHAYRSMRAYNSNILYNDVFPSDLLSYIKPIFDYTIYCNRVAEIYKEEKNFTKASYYKQIAEGKKPLSSLLNSNYN